jgi:hypothetical protein
MKDGRKIGPLLATLRSDTQPLALAPIVVFRKLSRPCVCDTTRAAPAGAAAVLKVWISHI